MRFLKRSLLFCVVASLTLFLISCQKNKEKEYFAEANDILNQFNPLTNSMWSYQISEDGRPLNKDSLIHSKKSYSYQKDPFYFHYENDKGTNQIYQEEDNKFYLYVLKDDVYQKEETSSSTKEDILSEIEYSFSKLALVRCSNVKYYVKITKDMDGYTFTIKLRHLLNEEETAWLNSTYSEAIDESIKNKILDSLLTLTLHNKDNVLTIRRTYTYYTYEDYLNPSKDKILSYPCENEMIIDLNSIDII